jgi:periplasmic protein CpxP/Spy
MKREYLLLGIIALLVVLNGGILFFFLGKGEAPRPSVEKIIVETLQFDEEQQRKLDELKLNHKRRLKNIDDSFDKSMETYFNLLQADTINQTQKNSLDSMMAAAEREKIRTTYDHFQDIRNICREDQREKFNAFLPQLVRFIMRPNPPKGKEPRERREDENDRPRE